MNLTLSADKETVRRAREVARRQGTSLNKLIRVYLDSLAAHSQDDNGAAELMKLMDEGAGDLQGRS